MERINYTILCQKNIRIISFQTLSVFVLSAEAAKSCSKGAIAAFGPGEILRVFGGGSKILLPRRDCCLWPRRVSSGLRQRQQNPAPEARLLPLGPAGFIGSPAEAAKSSSPVVRLLPLAPAGFIGSPAEAAKSCS